MFSSAASAPAPSELASAFAYEDEDRDGFVSFAQALRVYRACGYSLTTAEVALLSRAVSEAYGGSLALGSCVALAGTLAARGAPGRTAVTAALESFDVFRGRVAPGAGARAAPLSHKDLHLLLTSAGDRLSQREFITLARGLAEERKGAAGGSAAAGGPPDEAVDIRTFVTSLMPPEVLPAPGSAGGRR